LSFPVSSDGSSGSLSGVIIGAAVGAAVLIIAIVVIILVVILCIRRSQLKKASILDYNRVLSEGMAGVLYTVCINVCCM